MLLRSKDRLVQEIDFWFPVRCPDFHCQLGDTRGVVLHKTASLHILHLQVLDDRHRSDYKRVLGSPSDIYTAVITFGVILAISVFPKRNHSNQISQFQIR